MTGGTKGSCVGCSKTESGKVSDQGSIDRCHERRIKDVQGRNFNVLISERVVERLCRGRESYGLQVREERK